MGGFFPERRRLPRTILFGWRPGVLSPSHPAAASIRFHRLLRFSTGAIPLFAILCIGVSFLPPPDFGVLENRPDNVLLLPGLKSPFVSPFSEPFDSHCYQASAIRLRDTTPPDRIIPPPKVCLAAEASCTPNFRPPTNLSPPEVRLRVNTGWIVHATGAK